MTERKIYERDRHDADDMACLLEPQALAATGIITDTIDMQGFNRVLFCILGGAAEGSADTLDIEVLQCTGVDDANTDAKPLAGLYGPKAIATVTAGSGYAALNQKWLIEVWTDEMDVDAGFRYLELNIEVSADTWLLAVEAVRSTAAYEPVAQTYITEIVG